MTSKSMKKISLNLSLVIVAGLTVVACGVRGRPQPPLTPAELGRGEPSYKRATEELAFPNVPSPTPIQDPKSRQEGR